MIAVIFEVHIADGRKPDYLDIANELKPLLQEVDGFVSIERFQSLTDDKKLLSLSYWRDEAAVQEWRALTEHRAAQSKGRAGVFSNYRLTVAQTLRVYGMDDRAQAPDDSREVHG